MKNSILFVIVLLSQFLTSTAQEKNKFKLSYDLLSIGTNFTNSANVNFAIEPKYNINNKSSVGVRFSLGIFPSREIELSDSNFSIGSEGLFTEIIDGIIPEVIFSTHFTYEYFYLRNKTGVFQPFIGGGLGFYILGDFEETIVNQDNDVVNGSIQNQLGFLLRTGFELWKFRLGFEYNLIPRANIRISSNDIIGQINDSYLALSLGFNFGGGKWKN